MARTKETTDSNTLALLGKKEVLKRRFGFWSLFGFAVCELITWETVLALFSQGFNNGGPAGLVYGFIIAWSSTLSVYTVISELASMAPIAAGQYYWVYMLAPERYKVFSSYIVGWLTSLAWVATVATETIFAESTSPRQNSTVNIIVKPTAPLINIAPIIARGIFHGAFETSSAMWTEASAPTNVATLPRNPTQIDKPCVGQPPSFKAVVKTK